MLEQRYGVSGGQAGVGWHTLFWTRFTRYELTSNPSPPTAGTNELKGYWWGQDPQLPVTQRLGSSTEQPGDCEQRTGEATQVPSEHRTGLSSLQLTVCWSDEGVSKHSPSEDRNGWRRGQPFSRVHVVASDTQLPSTHLIGVLGSQPFANDATPQVAAETAQWPSRHL